MATPYAGSSHTIDIARGNIPRVNIPRGSCQASKGDIQAVTVLPRLSWVGQAVMGHSPCNGVKKKTKTLISCWERGKVPLQKEIVGLSTLENKIITGSKKAPVNE